MRARVASATEYSSEVGCVLPQGALGSVDGRTTARILLRTEQAVWVVLVLVLTVQAEEHVAWAPVMELSSRPPSPWRRANLVPPEGGKALKAGNRKTTCLAALRVRRIWQRVCKPVAVQYRISFRQRMLFATLARQAPDVS